MTYMKITAAALAFATAGAPLAAAHGDPIIPCTGAWAAYSSHVDGQHGAMRMRIREGRREGVADVTLEDCGRTMRAREGQTLELSRISEDPTVYEGRMDAGGVRRIFRMQVRSEQFMTGHVTVHGRARIDRPTNFRFEGGDEPDDLGCGDVSGEDEVPAASMRRVMVDALATRGLTPPAGLELTDYVTVDVTTPSPTLEERRAPRRDEEENANGADPADAETGAAVNAAEDDPTLIGSEGTHRRAFIWLDDSGKALPRRGAVRGHRIECEAEPGQIIGAHQMLAVTVIRSEGTDYVTVSLNDVATTAIQRQANEEAPSGEAGLAMALDRAWMTTGVTIDGLSTGLSAAGPAVP